MPRPYSVVLAVMLASACGGSSDGSDAGSGTDASPSAADATAATGLDATAEPGLDASLEAADAGGNSGCAAAFAGCADYLDATGPSADRTVSFTCCQYTPKCLKIAVGQSVTFSGPFGFHPVKQACGSTPVIASTSSGSSASFVFGTPGEFGFFCPLHGSADGTGMAGSILVE
ncbi:MAG: hypothetical protein HY901_19965 [Deltaproteobacteria bacterium]|nr:hypothetical protein [Deltaproteobacteria bacterium]